MNRNRLQVVPLIVLLLALAGSGCTRRFFRERADKDVSNLLTEKNVFEPWQIEAYHIYPDPRARFADPSDPDHPPMPSDDPAVRILSPNPQKPGKAGIGNFEGAGYLELLAAWDSMNRAELPPALPSVAGAGQKPDAPPVDATPNPGCPGDVNHPFLIKLEQACELGLVNSRDFQDQRENLYLSALPVSLQRFSFAAQLFGTANSAFEASGPQTFAGEGERFVGNVSTGFSKAFPTGALLLYKLANQYTFELLNGKPQVSVTSMTLDLTQPLLSGGGLAVNLEPLTQAERNLLYQIRTYARFRKQFYVNIATGGLFLSGASSFLDQSLGITATNSPSNTGYLPTVEAAVNLEVDRRNVGTLQQYLKRFQAFAEGGIVSQLQVDQVNQQLLQGQSTVLQDELLLKNLLDSYKIQLGLSPTLNLELDLSIMRPIEGQLSRFQAVLDEYVAVQNRLSNDYARPEDVQKLRERLRAELTTGRFVAGTRFSRRIVTEWDAWQKLTDEELRTRLAATRDKRRQVLIDQTDVEAQVAGFERRGAVAPPELLQKIQDLDRQRRLLDRQLAMGEFEQSLRNYEKQPWKAIADPTARDERRIRLFRDLSSSFEFVLVDARNERLQIVRESWPKLPPVLVDEVDLLDSPIEVAYAKSAQTALANRLDLMNGRAQLVDSWRQIAVRANSLLGVLDIGYHLDTSTPAGQAKPVNFSTDRTTQQVTLNAELPLVRRAERNSYRVGLINFQRRRRSLQSQEDVILNSVRAEIRRLRAVAEQYNIQQQQVNLAYLVVENALENFDQPQATGGGAAAAASLTQQLITAQQGLVRAQLQMYNLWTNYHTVRMNLFLDLELMPLDARGVWIDEYSTRERESANRPARDALPAGERLPPPQRTGNGGLRPASPYAQEKTQ